MRSWRPIGVARKAKRSQTSTAGAMKMPGISLSASKRVVIPDRQVSWLWIVTVGLLPKATASVDLVLGREDEFDQVGDPDAGCVRHPEGAKLLNEAAGNDGPFGEVELFEPPQNPVQRVEAELALGVLGAGRDDSQRRALGLLLKRLVHRWGGSSDACRGWGQRPRYVPVPAASK